MKLFLPGQRGAEFEKPKTEHYGAKRIRYGKEGKYED